MCCSLVSRLNYKTGEILNNFTVPKVLHLASSERDRDI